MSAAVVTSSVFLIIAMASIFAWLLTYLQIPQSLAAQISAVTDSRLGILFILAVFALVCGFFIDTLPALIILTPVLGPIAYSAGIDPLQFGMMLVLNLTIGMITPPVGPVLFVIATVGQLRLEGLSRAVLPLLLAEFIVLLLVIIATLLLRLYEIDRRYNFRSVAEWSWPAAAMLGVLLSAIATMGVLLVWARMGLCSWD